MVRAREDGSHDVQGESLRKNSPPIPYSFTDGVRGALPNPPSYFAPLYELHDAHKARWLSGAQNRS